MSLALIKDLNVEHAELIRSLAEIAEIGTLDAGVRQLLASLEKKLRAHVAHEETDFYPAMLKAAQANPQLEASLQMMSDEMEEISARVMKFLDTYIAGGTPAEFPGALQAVITLVTERIKKEEHYLYSKYIKLVEGGV
jgi:iron-sulfur cluster repair protein YtfE (RIC family)